MFFYEYTVKDHLGNARVNFQTNGALITNIEDHHYYPFGMKMEGIGSSTVANKYTYNDKELNDDFGLNWYDYGARWYDAALGRWGSVDPMAELQADNSPYAYVYNNPMVFVDPTGMFGEPVGADGLTNSQWIESSRPGNSWMADNYRKQNRQEDWLRGMLIGKIDGALNEEGPGDPPPYIACPLCPYAAVNGIAQVTISAKKTVRSSVNLNWLQNATAATQARRDMVGNDVRYLYTFADDSPGYWVEALNVMFMAEGVVDIGLWVAGRVAARAAAKGGVSFYRAMSNAEFAALEANQGLTYMAGKELFVSSSASYSRAYLQKSGYDVLVHFSMKPGAMNYFNEVGVFHRTVAGSSGWAGRGSLLWKLEQGVMNLGIQSNTHMFNPWIQGFKVIK